MVWVHGGAFSSGAGSLPWYSGERFAAQGDVVFVSINYRLGALGFLCLPGISPGNLGLLDQIAALRFVRDNIAVFGGDTDDVTVVGQSAGAASIAIMMTMPQASGLFHRAIMQSTPFGRMARTLEELERIGRRFAEVLGVKPGQAAELKALPSHRIVEAQGEVARLEKKFANVLAPFWPAIDGKVYPGEVAPALKSGEGSAVDTMIRTTREEMAAFYCIDEEVSKADRAAIEGVFDAMFPSGYKPYYDEFCRTRASGNNAALLGDLMSDAMFRIGTLRMAEVRADQGHPLMSTSSTGNHRPASKPATASRFRSCSTILETGPIADAQGRRPRRNERSGQCNAPGLDRLRPHRQARSSAAAAVAGLSARGSDDHAVRPRHGPVTIWPGCPGAALAALKPCIPSPSARDRRPGVARRGATICSTASLLPPPASLVRRGGRRKLHRQRRHWTGIG